MVKVEWKYNEEFKEIFLDIWFEKSPVSFNQAYDACSEIGNDMITWLSETNKKLFDNIYQQALKETKESIVER